MSPYVIESELVNDLVLAAEKMGVYVEQVGQRRAKGSGTSRGVTDLILYAGGKMLPVEVKRPKTDGTRGGRFSLEQLAAADRRRGCGVETYAPDSLEAFTCLVNWARFGVGKVCPSCPTVPRIGGAT